MTYKSLDRSYVTCSLDFCTPDPMLHFILARLATTNALQKHLSERGQPKWVTTVLNSTVSGVHLNDVASKIDKTPQDLPANALKNERGYVSRNLTHLDAKGA